jgi:hypothetical protein
VKQSLSSSQVAVVGTDISVAINDTLRDDNRYSVQIFAKDLAGNVTVRGPSNATADTLVFDKQFQNPGADSIVVATATGDTVVAGTAREFTLSAIDSALTRKAGGTLKKSVTYGKAGVLVRVDAGTRCFGSHHRRNGRDEHRRYRHGHSQRRRLGGGRADHYRRLQQDPQRLPRYR